MRIALEKGITFNGMHSYDDYKMMLVERKIGLPSKKKILETPPYSNVEYDFSLLYGEQIYEQREITYTFTLFNHHNIPDLEDLRVMCINWLMGVDEQSRLTDDEIEDFYFLGEVREAPECTFDYETDSYEIQVTFTCYPFKICEHDENDDWDSFNFDTDVFQDTKFSFVSQMRIALYNTGATTVYPTVNVSVTGAPTIMESLEIKTGDGTVYTYTNGIYRAGIALKRGANNLTLTTIEANLPANVEFLWRKEVL